MQTPQQAWTAKGQTGETLPATLKILADNGIHFRRGQMSMLFAAPGVGKSVVTTAMLQAWCQLNVPALWFSADTDPATSITRLAAAATGHTLQTVEHGLHQDYARSFYLNEIDYPLLECCFDSSPSLEDISLEIDAYVEVYGIFPHVIIVDNLINLFVEGDEWTALRTAMDVLHQVGRETQAHVMVLHHATGEYDNGDRPLPLSAVNGKISKIPEMILGLCRQWGSGGDVLGFSPVKNRTGKARADGSWQLWANMDLDRVRVWTPERIDP